MARYEDVFILKDKVSDKLQKISGTLNKFDNKLVKSNEKLINFNNTLSKIGGALVTVFGVQKIAQVSHNISKLGMEFEDVRVDLETMLGSVEKADVMFKDIMTMAAKTPFESKDLLDATKQMLSFGIAEKDVIKYSKMLGDISGGNNERFKSLVLAFSQVSSVGKLQGQDKLQMINAGFNPLKELSEMTGKSMAQLDKEMSKGKISIDLVIKAMERATSKGGKFYNLMEKRSQTMSGKLSTLADTFSLWAGLTGEKINRKLLPILDRISPIIEKLLNNLTPLLIKSTDNFVKLFDAISNSTSFAIMKESLTELTSALNKFYEENKEFFEMLQKIFSWLLTTGIPNLITSLTFVLKFIMNIFNMIHKVFAFIGGFIGNIIGFIISLPNTIQTVFTNIVTNIIKLFTPLIRIIQEIKTFIRGKIASTSSVGNTTNNTTTNSNNVYNINNYGGSGIAQLTASAKYAI